MKEIQLANGKGIAIVDDCDYDLVSKYKWHIHSRGYAVTTLPRNPETKKQKTIRMHRLIMNPPDNMDIDHFNHDTLDNRRENLRICTTANNGGNRVKNKGVTSSLYKGVTLSKYRKLVAQIRFEGKYIHLGNYANEIDAARAYNRGARYYFGEFALLNQFENN